MTQPVAVNIHDKSCTDLQIVEIKPHGIESNLNSTLVYSPTPDNFLICDKTIVLREREKERERKRVVRRWVFIIRDPT